MSDITPMFPTWLEALRQAIGYDLTPDRGIALMDAVHAMELDEDTMMQAAESLAAKWPIKGVKLLDMTYRAWLRRERIRLNSKTTVRGASAVDAYAQSPEFLARKAWRENFLKEQKHA